jgi:hypothetical protein
LLEEEKTKVDLGAAVCEALSTATTRQIENAATARAQQPRRSKTRRVSSAVVAENGHVLNTPAILQLLRQQREQQAAAAAQKELNAALRADKAAFNAHVDATYNALLAIYNASGLRKSMLPFHRRASSWVYTHMLAPSLMRCARNVRVGTDGLTPDEISVLAKRQAACEYSVEKKERVVDRIVDFLGYQKPAKAAIKRDAQARLAAAAPAAAAAAAADAEEHSDDENETAAGDE